MSAMSPVTLALPWKMQLTRMMSLCPPIACLVILILATLVQGLTPCSPDCACYHGDGGQVVSCRYQNLAEVPKDLPSDTVELDMGHSVLPKIDINTFPLLPNLKRLIIDWCQVERIEEDSFGHLTNVQYIKLSHNAISDVHTRAFRGLVNLRKLHLDNNQIKNLSHAIFNELTLEELLLHDNGIQTLDSKAFEGSSIVNLNLDENNISNISIELFTPLKNSLKNFNLSHNEQPLKLDVAVFSGFNFSDLKLSYDGLKDPAFLKHIKAHSLDISGHPFVKLDFSGCENFRTTDEFYLRNLNIEILNETILFYMESVTLLDLSQNQLAYIDGDVFKYTPKLRVLRLDSNLFISLPENLGMHLDTLEVLKVPQNKLAMVRPDAFQGMSQLFELDMRNNHIQVIEESMKDILSSLDTVMLGGNPLHCNCEMRWYRRWLNDTGKDTGAFECFSPKANHIFDMLPSEFICRSPQVTYVTANMNAAKDESVYLTCSAEGDPAPEVQWSSPFGEIVSVTPPFNRTRYVTYAIWHVSRIQPYQGGWFTCMASNRKGQHHSSMYIHVYEPGGSTIDVSSMTMPTTTPPSTTSTTTSTTSPTTTTPIPTTTTTTQTTTPTTTPTTVPTPSPTTTPSSSATIPTTNRVTKGFFSADDDQSVHIQPWMIGVIVGCILGAILIVTIAGVCIHKAVQKKYVRKYDVSRECGVPMVHNNNQNHSTK